MEGCQATWLRHAFSPALWPSIPPCSSLAELAVSEAEVLSVVESHYWSSHAGLLLGLHPGAQPVAVEPAIVVHRFAHFWGSASLAPGIAERAVAVVFAAVSAVARCRAASLSLVSAGTWGRNAVPEVASSDPV